ncbi:metal-dependent hydrolase [Leucothrix pacifica]|uniref:Metal-dependent hydrolase n=1 Tax=Leucothrix pacifica TaxID=1247513 RepID=A0A317CGT4_9GAMM|nr:metal-dependent hydrolase [Leucothrix pacifica]PWQ97746.1 metal-dependent hydrolase [Leucothrix pacifica]
MDPVTQGAFGAVFAQTQGRSKDLAKAAVIGAIAGMAPDLDVLIRSDSDPLLALEFHRHFSHSLLFIPIGGLLCSLLLYPLLGKRWGLSFLQTYLWCVIGFGTHGLLDGCTSYGTQLLWPLSDHRFAWDIISIIDPLVSIPVLALIILAARRKARKYVYFALAWLAMYFGLSYTLHERAIEAGYQQAALRGHTPITMEAKPSFANIVVWKVIYQTEKDYYVDAVKVSFAEPVYWQGDSIPKLDLDRDFPWLDKQSQQAKDIERFRWFSGGYISQDKHKPDRVIDIRYSLLPQEINPLWGIDLTRDAAADKHIEYFTERGDSREAIGKLWKMIQATKPE